MQKTQFFNDSFFFSFYITFNFMTFNDTVNNKRNIFKQKSN